MKLFSVTDWIKPNLEGKLLELNVEISQDFIKELDNKCLYNIAAALFSKPLYFDSKGNKVEYSSNYKKVIINSKLTNSSGNISGLLYLSEILNAYRKAVRLGKKSDNGKIIVNLSNIKGSNKLYLADYSSEHNKYFNGVISIIREIPFLSIKKD